MFLDPKYFQGELYLPNIKRSGDAVGVGAIVQTVSENDLGWYIEKYEREFLYNLLGEKLSDNFIQGVADGGEIWTKLFDMIYNHTSGYNYSPAAYYVYYYVHRWAVSQLTMNGEARSTADYSQIAPSNFKLETIWNDMVRQVKHIYRFLRENWEDYKPYADQWQYHRFRHHCRTFTPINTFGI